jgi:hypothetical protein
MAMTDRKSSISDIIFYTSECGSVTSTKKEYVELMEGKTKQYYFDNPSIAKKHMLLGGTNLILDEYNADKDRVFRLTRELSKDLKKGNWNYFEANKKIDRFFRGRWEDMGYAYRDGLYSII